MRRDPINNNEGWFDLRRYELMPVIEIRNKLLRRSKLFEGNDDFFKKNCAEMLGNMLWL